MAHEPTFRRVVVACDGACDITIAVGDAAALAARWGAVLHGIYVEDQALRRLAALPFGRQVSLSNLGVSQALSVEEADALSASVGAAMRRSLEEAARRHGVAWSFHRTDDLLSIGTEAEESAELLVLEGTARAFSGTWRARTGLEYRADAHGGTVLIRRRQRPGRGVVVILAGGESQQRKLLAAGAAMASEDEPPLVLAARPDAAALSSASPKPRIELLPEDSDAALSRIVALDPSVVVVGGDEELLRRLIAEAHCDVLVVR